MNEDQFFSELFRGLPRPPAEVVVPPGDDCAAIETAPGKWHLLATDQVVGGRHYVLGEAGPSPRAVGRKLLARNLSDIAAMGGVPRFCLVAVAAPPRRESDWLAELLAGVVELGKTCGVHMIGGDLARSLGDEVASLTIVGEVNAETACRRSGAQAGDVLLATGRFGRAPASGRHLTFEPRLREGRWLAERGRARAMIDVSDGLLLDACRLAVASRLCLSLDCARIPLADSATLEDALGDGEDYELLAAVAPEVAEEVLVDWPFADTALTAIGRFAPGDPGVCDAKGNDLLAVNRAGYDHFSIETSHGG